MNLFITILILVGMLIPALVYRANMERYLKMKSELEDLTGVLIQTSWKKHRREIGVGWYRWIIVLYLLFMIVHSTMDIPSIISILVLIIVPLAISLILLFPYVDKDIPKSNWNIGKITRGFILSEFIELEELLLWKKDNIFEYRYGKMAFVDELMIKHGDYIPMIQNTIPLIHKKRQFLDLILDARVGVLTPSEEKKVGELENYLREIDVELEKRWKELMIALGEVTRPEVIQERKEESFRQLDELLRNKELKVTSEN